MFFTGKNILVISPEAWDHLFVSKHNYALTLAKHNNVYFLNPPGSSDCCKPTQYKNVWELNYTRFIRGIRFFPKFFQLVLMRIKYNQLQKRAAIVFDCVWSFDNSVFFDFSFLPSHVLTISHIVDYSQNFQFICAAKTAKICLGLSQNIVDRLKKVNSNSYLMPHGISLDFVKAWETNLPGQNKVKAVYAGNLDSKYIDKQILYQIVDNNPQIDFIFFGPGANNWKKTNNTYFPGAIPSEYLISCFEKADVLLMFYNTHKFPEQLTNSHKLLEYLSSGKVTVSSYVKDYSDKEHLLKMVTDNSNLPLAFKEVISNLAFYNSKKNVEVRKRFASENTYCHRIKEIEHIIDESLS